MASRTYLPTLLVILHTLCQYIVTHRDRILNVIGVEHTTKLDAITLACAAFEAVARPHLPEGS